MSVSTGTKYRAHHFPLGRNLDSLWFARSCEVQWEGVIPNTFFFCFEDFDTSDSSEFYLSTDSDKVTLFLFRCKTHTFHFSLCAFMPGLLHILVQYVLS